MFLIFYVKVIKLVSTSVRANRGRIFLKNHLKTNIGWPDGGMGRHKGL
jgi:hypothetical protein